MVFSWGKKSVTGFNKYSTAEEVTEGVDGTGLTAIITGATGGVGKESTRVLSKRGVHVVMAVRNLETAATLKEEILKENPAAKLDIIKLDTSSLASVRTAAKEFLDLNLPLNILMNNAGIMFGPYKLSADGVEMQFATNYLGHFLLTNLLLDKMKETAKESGIQGRILNVSSIAHNFFTYPGGIRFDGLNDKEGYDQFKAYAQSKLAQILTTMELAKRLEEENANVTVNALHPGAISTNLGSGTSFMPFVYKMFRVIPGVYQPPEQGAGTQCYLALNPGAKGVNGKYYFDDVNERPSPSKYATDEMAKKLWDYTLNMIPQ